ncbi:putative LPS assembly protein LptD [Coprobacter tertius]|uniref:LPS assembly protein LptD n=1 Tax=Coprobacter tertius TaxID=2944915 RepID=A0ABT1MET3_9BACT|nr:putative LPS assembly protein LptD [Coprobacter tertius]MCP9610891.1 putative LPS assembly protein LptD [Coprobacter tertius]
MLPKNKTLISIIASVCTLLIVSLSAQPKRAEASASFNAGILFPADSLDNDSLTALIDSFSTGNAGKASSDTLPNDSLKTDTASVKSKKNVLDDVVKYKAQDSIVFMNGNIAYMYGNGVVNYLDIELDADEIRMNLDSSLVNAIGRPDTSGEIVGNPVFKDKSGTYESKTMKYNFKSQKGYITNIITQQGEGYFTGGQTKKMKDGDLFALNGKYTTCDNHDHPHFYLQLTKAKIRPKKNIISGPAYMVLADVPLPLAIPFGFFPMTKKYSSGIIMPTFGDEMNRGFYLRDGGYYFAISDYIDLALTGEIYTKGSWGLGAQSNYVKRYKYSGSFNIGYLVTILGDKGMPDYSKQKNFRLTWNHSQDAKANPNMSFSASVNFTTSGYDRNNLNSYYNPTTFTENTKSSTVNMTYNFPNTPFSISATTNITQRSNDSTLAVSFPDFTLNMSRVYPFKRKNPVGKERWYEKISMNYTGIFRNSIETKQNLFLKSNLIKDWRNGMQHDIPISATFNLFKYLNLSPSFKFTDRMYTNKILREWDPAKSTEVMDTTYGFYNVYNYSLSVSAQTKLYGFYQPLPFMGDKIQTIRHVFTPSVSFTAAPDFSDPRFGFYDTYTKINSQGIREDVLYSPFQQGMFSTAPQGKQGLVSFSVANNLEMKVKSDRDTTGIRKISLIENLTASMSYNMAADSMKWSNINTSILIKLTKDFNLQMSATFDTYTYQLNSAGQPVRVNIPRWKAGKGLGRLSSTGTSFSYTLNNNTFKRKKDNKKGEIPQAGEKPMSTDNQDSSPTTGADQNEEQNSEEQFGADGYMKWEVPWSLSINYSINYGYGTFNKQKMEYNGKITQNLSFSGNVDLTKNWSFNFSASYDFNLKKIAYMNCSIRRNLHCWSMSADFIPVGPYKSYNFHISVNSSLLSDLKYDKHGSAYDRLKWY